MKIKTLFMLGVMTNTAIFMADSQAVSFNCAKASTLVEKALCAEKPLSDLDDTLGQAYKTAQANSKNSSALKKQQLNWLSTVRNKCQDSACLSKVYQERIAELKAAAAKPNDETMSCRKELGKKQAQVLVKQCTQISPASHPPCHDENPCSLIKDEIKRSCDYTKNTKGATIPGFCNT